MHQKIKWNILLHDIRSVQNVASIFRMAECLGVHKIYLSGITPGPADRFGREREDFVKISLGTETAVGWERLDRDVLGFIELWKTPPNPTLKEGRSSALVIGLEQNKNSLDYKKVSEEIQQNFKKGVVKEYLIIPGREVEGLDENILELCDIVAEIPQYGNKESLNIFSSMSVACFRFFDQ